MAIPFGYLIGIIFRLVASFWLCKIIFVEIKIAEPPSLPSQSLSLLNVELQPIQQLYSNSIWKEYQHGQGTNRP